VIAETWPSGVPASPGRHLEAGSPRHSVLARGLNEASQALFQFAIAGEHCAGLALRKPEDGYETIESATDRPHAVVQQHDGDGEAANRRRIRLHQLLEHMQRLLIEKRGWWLVWFQAVAPMRGGDCWTTAPAYRRRHSTRALRRDCLRWTPRSRGGRCRSYETSSRRSDAGRAAYSRLPQVLR